MDTLYKHNSVFGWLNTFRILPTNVYLGRFGARPIAPPIISDPSLGQVFRNWNIADTGAFVTFYILGLILSKRGTSQMGPAVYVEVKRSLYFMMTNVGLAIAVFVGSLNSANRLRGFVPNGLTWSHAEPARLKKFDYTSDLLERNLVLKWLVPLGL